MASDARPMAPLFPWPRQAPASTALPRVLFFFPASVLGNSFWDWRSTRLFYSWAASGFPTGLSEEPLLCLGTSKRLGKADQRRALKGDDGALSLPFLPCVI